MAEKKKAKKKKQSEPTAAVSRLKYKQITVEFAFTDGGIETVTFYSPADCFRYIERTISEQYTNSVRVELFWNVGNKKLKVLWARRKDVMFIIQLNVRINLVLCKETDDLLRRKVT